MKLWLLILLLGASSIGGGCKKTPTEQPWVPMSQVATANELTVTIQGASVGTISQSTMGMRIPSKDVYSKVLVTIHNGSEKNKLYVSWQGRLGAASRDYATLTDDHGNDLVKLVIGAMGRPEGQLPDQTLKANESITDLIVFDPPLPAAKELHLELPTANIGGTGMIRFAIPMSSVKIE